MSARKKLEETIAHARTAIALAAQAYVAEVVQQSLGTAPAADLDEPRRNRPARTRKPARAKKPAKVAAPKPAKRTVTKPAPVKRSRTSREVMLVREQSASEYAAGGQFFAVGDFAKYADIPVKDASLTLRNMVSAGKLVIQGEKRNARYRKATKSNGVAERAVELDEDSAGVEA